MHVANLFPAEIVPTDSIKFDRHNMREGVLIGCKTMKKSFLTLFIFLSLAACMSPSESLFDYWLGPWTGPEGTSLLINEHKGGYEVVITNLDGPRRFPVTIQGMGLSFTRDGVVEILHEGNGLATGMKWLAGKQRCLIVKPGEGYCRD